TIENITKENPEELLGPPRLIVEELYLTKESFERLVEETDGLITEVKTENQINRITSRANPRKVERVPAGAVFKGRMVFSIYEDSDLNEPLSLVFYGMRLLEDNYLGGYGSRGSGRVKFQNLTVKFRSKGFYLGSSKEEHLGDYKDLEALFEKLEDMKQQVGGVVK
ncbi:MAG: type III-A CRISPR-associated RAMP protein Csm3, partial [Aquificaceae bacterium]|nr:type III-A CRISPR-associated RAMP protein Csm3 [Aquificaceae bacterium]